jgi:NADPH-dependent curcumin reductase CurA
MAEYNQKDRVDGPPTGFWIRARASVYGLVVYDFEARRGEFIDACLPLVEQGKLTLREDVADGLEYAADAFCRLMRGENIGKAIVKVS